MKSYNSIYLDENKTFTTEEIAYFRSGNLALNSNIAQALSKPGREVIQDGVFDYEGYLRSKVKILWLMKEPYDTAGGGWHISDLYKKEFGADRTTWYPIINASHSILNNFQLIEPPQQMKKGNTALKEVLLHIAYMNVQKLPSLTREKTNNGVIHAAFNNQMIKDFFVRQFELLNPDIIIGANTLGMMFAHFGLKGPGLSIKPTDNSYVVNGKLFINTRHPAQRGNKRAYLENIVSAAKKWNEHLSSTPKV